MTDDRKAQAQPDPVEKPAAPRSNDQEVKETVKRLLNEYREVFRQLAKR